MTHSDIPNPVDRMTAPHYTWGSNCDGWHLLRSPALSVIEERMPPGTAEVRHYHRHATQFFYVLAGELSIELDGREFQLSPGQGIAVLPGTPHEVRNRHTSDATFLVISTPPGHGDRVPAPETDSPRPAIKSPSPPPPIARAGPPRHLSHRLLPRRVRGRRTPRRRLDDHDLLGR